MTTTTEPIYAGVGTHRRTIREAQGARKRIYPRNEVVIDILPDDIRRSHPNSEFHCAGNTACRRQLPEVVEALFYPGRVYLVFGPDNAQEGWVEVRRPSNALAREIVKYDSPPHPFTPGRYKLSPLPPSDFGEGRRKRQSGTPTRDGRANRTVALPPVRLNRGLGDAL